MAAAGNAVGTSASPGGHGEVFLDIASLLLFLPYNR